MPTTFKVVLVAACLSLFGVVATGRAAEEKSFPIDHAIGKADAPITIIEYSSLTCPHCADFQADVIPRLKAEWLDTGKARLIFRDFPLDGLALGAAMVAQCSGDRYFQFIDAFFKNQAVWERATDPAAAIKNIAKLGGLSGATVDKCLGDTRMMRDIQDRKQDAIDRYHIEATPSFVINGKMFAGALPYDEFVAKLKP